VLAVLVRLSPLLFSPHCHLSSLLSPFILFFPSVVLPPVLFPSSSRLLSVFFFTFSPPLFSSCSFCPCSPLLFFFILSQSPHYLVLSSSSFSLLLSLCFLSLSFPLPFFFSSSLVRLLLQFL